MLSKSSFQKRNENKTLNELCEQYCKCIVCAFRINSCLRKDPDWLCKNTNSNDIKEETFLQLIKRSSSILIGWSFTEAVVDIVDEPCITGAVFNELLMISNRDIHDNMCISLSHKHLSESMLIKLCETQLCHESFYELASLCYTDPNISCASFIDSINRFLEGNFCEDYTYLLRGLDTLKASEVSKEIALKQMKALYNNIHIPTET